jgi:hypothetical protein
MTARWGRLAPHVRPAVLAPLPSGSLFTAASNRSLRCILTIVSCRFDPRAEVHPTRLYKQRQTHLLNQSIIPLSHYYSVQGSPSKG